MKIVITEASALLNQDYSETFALFQRLLPEAIVEIVPYEGPEKLVAAAKDADAILTAFVPFSGEVLRALPRCRVISISATGYGTIDVQAAGRQGIYVCAIDEYCTGEVADHTMALMLALLRKLKQSQRSVEAGRWAIGTAVPPPRISGLTLGIYGFGKIGRAVAQRAQAFGIRVLTLNRPSARKANAPGVELVEEAELLKRSDVISNHMSASEENRNFFDAARFAQMERRPFFLNLGRGSCVDEAALVRALDDGILSGAGLDVLKEEASVLNGHPLLGRKNVIITPHSAFYSKASMEALRRIPCENLACCLQNRPGEAQRVVNAPWMTQTGR